jgi:hypothetical protein
VATELRQELTLREQLSLASLNAFYHIERNYELSVALHIRLTDGLHASSSHHGILPMHYYTSAVRKIAAPYIYVFSDNPGWCRTNLPTHLWNFRSLTTTSCNPMSGFCDENGVIHKGTRGREYEDLWLMSSCKHIITANSTFSWWAAWLNPNPGTIITPKQWFLGRHDSTDIVPERWIAL